MAKKNENEITVKVICSKKELLECLLNKGFIEGKKFMLDDYYLIPRSLNIKEMTERQILSKAIIIRNIINQDGNRVQMIMFKIKNISNNGDIISQESINCSILNIDEAKDLFKAIGYYEIMNIKENDIIFYKEKFEIMVKFIENSDILIEIETKANTKWNTIKQIKEKLEQIDLPIEKNNYFVKKAENELNKILKRKD